MKIKENSNGKQRKRHEHLISAVEDGSIAMEMGIEPGDKLLSINGQEIEDVFDYHYYVNDEELLVLIEKPDGEQWELEIEKDYEEDLGLHFEQADGRVSVLSQQMRILFY